ncbi:MAG: hypothetical protein KME57_15145 [Scytonema hyalinum WJT4-NPBG1]|nr:hypothetical protein [Scytonema hyalinum WJT4-NPBG1]
MRNAHGLLPAQLVVSLVIALTLPWLLRFRYAHLNEKPGDSWFVQQAVNLRVPIPSRRLVHGQYLNQTSVV